MSREAAAGAAGEREGEHDAREEGASCWSCSLAWSGYYITELMRVISTTAGELGCWPDAVQARRQARSEPGRRPPRSSAAAASAAARSRSAAAASGVAGIVIYLLFALLGGSGAGTYGSLDGVTQAQQPPSQSLGDELPDGRRRQHAAGLPHPRRREQRPEVLGRLLPGARQDATRRRRRSSSPARRAPAAARRRPTSGRSTARSTRRSTSTSASTRSCTTASAPRAGRSPRRT